MNMPDGASILSEVTIGIPVYNEAPYLRATVESCLGQAGRILLYDNASSDASAQICAEYAAAHQGVIHVRHPENIGAAANFKAPLFACRTAYFCWVGGHDLLEPGYTLALARYLEGRPDVVLACGTIRHMDEQDRPRGRPTRSVFLDPDRDRTPLDRMEMLAIHLRDCFIFHGLHRTEALREAWFDEPCLGIDRIVLYRCAARGGLAYVPEAVYRARDFPRQRDARQDRARRSESLGHEAARPLAKSNFSRNLQLIRTVLDQAVDDASLSQALRIIERIRRRHHERRRHQKRRLLLALVALGVLAGGIVLCV